MHPGDRELSFQARGQHRIPVTQLRQCPLGDIDSLDPPEQRRIGLSDLMGNLGPLPRIRVSASASSSHPKALWRPAFASEAASSRSTPTRSPGGGGSASARRSNSPASLGAPASIAARAARRRYSVTHLSAVGCTCIR